MTASTVVRFPHRASPTTRVTIASHAVMCARYPLDETNPYLDPAVREVGVALMSESGYPLDGREVLDLFVHLVDTLQRLHDLEANRSEYLGSLRLPVTDVQYDVTRGTLLADREHWTARLLALGGVQ